MKSAHPPHGKILDHLQGAGAATPETVVQRAREDALINGRHPNQYSPEDLTQARRELLGEPDPGPGDEDGVAALTEWDAAPGDAGHSVEKIEPPDEQTMQEELVEEGIHEAEHEQMVEGAKNHLH